MSEQFNKDDEPINNNPIYKSYIELLADKHVGLIESNIYHTLTKNSIVGYIFKDIIKRTADGRLKSSFNNNDQIKYFNRWYELASYISENYDIISPDLPIICYRAVYDSNIDTNKINKLDFDNSIFEENNYFSLFSKLKVGDILPQTYPFSCSYSIDSALGRLNEDEAYRAIFIFKIHPKSTIADIFAPSNISTYITIINKNNDEEKNKDREIIVESGYFIINKITKSYYEELYEDTPEYNIRIDFDIIECDFIPKLFENDIYIKTKL